MLKITKRFWQDEQGQDLIEYTLLMAFVALASAALFISSGSSISAIWSDPTRNCLPRLLPRPAKVEQQGERPRSPERGKKSSTFPFFPPIR